MAYDRDAPRWQCRSQPGEVSRLDSTAGTMAQNQDRARVIGSGDMQPTLIAEGDLLVRGHDSSMGWIKVGELLRTFPTSRDTA